MPSGNFSYVFDSTFQPFSMQELLTPYLMYKDAFEKAEESYMDLTDKADTFKYLSKTLPEGSKARAIYEGYANDLAANAKDLNTRGLMLSNRSALTALKRRYKGEIGRLEKADEAMQEARKLRRARLEQDSSMLYATDVFNIDDFLDGGEPNLYGISGAELYARGKEIGKSSSSRIFSAKDAGSILGGYFRDYVEKSGYDPKAIAEFRKNAASIPELQLATDALLEERGVMQNLANNPTALNRARLSVINGIIDGIVYTEKHNPVRDPGVMSAKERSDAAVAQGQLALSRARLAHDIADSNRSYALQAQKYKDERNSKYIFDDKGNVIGVNTKGTIPPTEVKLDQTVYKVQGGQVSDAGAIKAGSSRTLGTQITYDEAVKREPAVANIHPNYTKYYNYYRGTNGGIVIKRNDLPNPYDYLQPPKINEYDFNNRNYHLPGQTDQSAILDSVNRGVSPTDWATTWMRDSTGFGSSGWGQKTYNNDDNSLGNFEGS